jgi:hypothetical protein
MSYADKLARLQEMRRELRALEQSAETEAKRMQPLTEHDERQMYADQATFDQAYMGANRKAPPPLAYERPDSYKRRLAAGLQSLSPRWAKVDLASQADSVFAIASEQIRSDAIAAGPSAGIPAGTMRERVEGSSAGHKVITFHGNDVHFTEQFRRPPRVAVWINESDRAAVRPPIETRAYPQMVQVPRASF